MRARLRPPCLSLQHGDAARQGVCGAVCAWPLALHGALARDTGLKHSMGARRVRG